MIRIKSGKYYLIKREEGIGNNHIIEELLGRFIGELEKGHPRYLFEFIEDINGHDGNKLLIDSNLQGLQGHCWYVDLEDIIKMIPDKKVMVYEL